jgi:hypothetical protein
VEPLSESEQLADVDAAYAVQQAWTDLRRGAGDTVFGRTIGPTSVAVQQQLGVDEPDYGALWGSRFYTAKDGRATLPRDEFLQPRVEGELAFLMGEPPRRPDIGVEDVLAATEAVAAAIEIVDSRIADWRITSALSVALSLGADRVAEGAGSAALGHPPARWTGRPDSNPRANGPIARFRRKARPLASPDSVRKLPVNAVEPGNCVSRSRHLEPASRPGIRASTESNASACHAEGRGFESLQPLRGGQDRSPSRVLTGERG